MLLLLLNYVVLRALWKIDVHLISTLVNKSLIIIWQHKLRMLYTNCDNIDMVDLTQQNQ